MTRIKFGGRRARIQARFKTLCLLGREAKHSGHENEWGASRAIVGVDDITTRPAQKVGAPR